MAPHIASLNVLLLAEGRSSRMGYPKYLLAFPDGRQSFIHAAETLHAAFPEAKGIYMLLRHPSQRNLLQGVPNAPLDFLYSFNPTERSAPDFSAVIQHDPESHWLMMPCDHFLMTPHELRRLVSDYQEPVTCLRNGLGQLQPLVSLWSPAALAYASKNARNRLELCQIVEHLGGTSIQPLYDCSLFNVNTPEEWEEAKALMGGSR